MSGCASAPVLFKKGGSLPPEPANEEDAAPAAAEEAKAVVESKDTSLESLLINQVHSPSI
ncbi:hypothetical protein SAY87_007995 [Trapa incisa]|uniref:Uncharacterized protein n=1 Tax=Trapa incisa TaxID=236973 RepID=A0AAN7QG81_9MYRT|nr:hypothetical protein SAY87_007995 [Trapa incisa]